MKKLLCLLLLSPFFAKAQEKPLIAEGISPSLYITHKVAPKENFYSIGRIYNISPREIAPFNNLQLESGLNPGQVLRIPLSASNFFQSGTAEADEIFVPLYHIVSTKEGLYRIGVNYNNLPLETLKQWNNIKSDDVKNGTKLIIGYLKVKKELSDLAKYGIGSVIKANEIAVVKQEEKKTAGPDVKSTVSESKTAKAEPEKKVPVKAMTEETVQVKPVKEHNNEKEKLQPNKVNTGKIVEGGVFKDLYDSQIKNNETVNAEGISGVFKSTSGWSDKKYYCLHNEAPQGTIVKITNPANGKFVFAKVLDLMPDIRQNEGLLICISNAAAEALGATDGNFNCSINYSK